MLSFGPSQRYFLYRHPTDMRKSFDGLSGLVRKELGRDPTSGDVFIFLNRRQTHIKLLVWDRSGFALYYKRLEEGTLDRKSTRLNSSHVASSYAVLCLQKKNTRALRTL